MEKESSKSLQRVEKSKTQNARYSRRNLKEQENGIEDIRKNLTIYQESQKSFFFKKKKTIPVNPKERRKNHQNKENLNSNDLSKCKDEKELEQVGLRWEHIHEQFGLECHNALAFLEWRHLRRE